jgi:mannose-1-phosphate guanylyltransferase
MEKKIINLKGIILVGGHSSGTRFRPLSMELPKPLFPIGGKPMIYHHVNALSKVPGMKEVLIIGFYEAGVFDRFLTETQVCRFSNKVD